jgi:hypothetical protein
MKDNTHAIEVGRRLRETAWELGFRSQQQLADWLGATRPQVHTWYNGIAMPPVKYMQQLAEQRGVTLDWIYRGDGSGLSNTMYIRLMSAIEGRRLPDPELEPDAAPESAGPAYPPRKDRGRQPPGERSKAARVA